jgi:hypothetical protein
MDKQEYICIKTSPGLFWKIGEKYEFSRYEVEEFKNHLKFSKFYDWFLTIQEYRDFIIEKIINE